jgi:hypothetical protein
MIFLSKNEKNNHMNFVLQALNSICDNPKYPTKK